MESGRAPQGSGGGHLGNQRAEFRGDRRAAHDGAAGAPGPVVAEPSPLPAQDGVRGDDDQRLLPASPQPGQRDPKEPVATAQPRSGHRPPVHGELLAQGEILEGELPVAAAEEREESEQGEQRADQKTAIVSGSKPRDQPLGRRMEFWRRTGLALC